MVHCGYEPTAAEHSLARPWAALMVKLRGIRTTGPMVPEIDLGKARPAQYMFDRHVQEKLREIRLAEEAASEAQEEGRRPATNAA